MRSCNESTLKASQHCGSANIQGGTQCYRLWKYIYIQRGCSSNVQEAAMTQLGRGLMSWHMGLTGHWMVFNTMHPSYRVRVSGLQDDELSAPKPKIPYKIHCYLALCTLQSAQTPAAYPTCWYTTVYTWPHVVLQVYDCDIRRRLHYAVLNSIWVNSVCAASSANPSHFDELGPGSGQLCAQGLDGPVADRPNFQ